MWSHSASVPVSVSRAGDEGVYKGSSPGFVIFVQRTIDMMNAEGRSFDWRNVPAEILRQIERNWEGLSADHRRDFENQGALKDSGQCASVVCEREADR